MPHSARFDASHVPQRLKGKSGRVFVRAKRPRGVFVAEDERPWRAATAALGTFLHDDNNVSWVRLTYDGPQDVWGEFWYREV